MISATGGHFQDVTSVVFYSESVSQLAGLSQGDAILIKNCSTYGMQVIS